MNKKLFCIDKKGTLFCVNNKVLLAIAAAVWFAAGFNVARLGILSYYKIEFKLFQPLFTIIIFTLFGNMFYRLTVKHTSRILSYDSKQPFWRFFDAKGYAIMAVMMTGGFGLRGLGVLPDVFIACFYTGLGSALALAGILFLLNIFIKEK